MMGLVWEEEAKTGKAWCLKSSAHTWIHSEALIESERVGYDMWAYVEVALH